MAVLCHRCVQVAAVGNITVYVRRYYVRNDVRRILTVVPGLEAKMASSENDQPDDLPETVVGVDVGTARPTASTSNAIFWLQPTTTANIFKLHGSADLEFLKGGQLCDPVGPSQPGRWNLATRKLALHAQIIFRQDHDFAHFCPEMKR